MITNAFKLYLPSGKYKIIDENDFIEIAQDRMMHNSALRAQYLTKKITKLTALKIFQRLNIEAIPINAFEIELPNDKVALKTIQMIEAEIAQYIFKNAIENYNEFSGYLSGSQRAMVELITEKLSYKSSQEDQNIEDFIKTEVYFVTQLNYKKNKITVELSPEKFICNKTTESIYKYKSTIIDESGYKFTFKKNELFRYREEAIDEAKKLIDEHYNLPIRNSKIQKVIVRKDDKNTIIVFWPEITTDDNFIISNDVIGDFDLGGETKTSMAFFDSCKDVTAKELIKAKNVIQSCLKLQTYNVKHI